jgi:steroid 5-alpha reductase family enzyme
MFLILLFMGSSMFSESISIQKYPDYNDYIKEVPKYVPLRKS